MIPMKPLVVRVDSVEQVRSHRGAALFVVPAGLLSDVLPLLGDEQDIILAGAPDELVEHRLQRLGRARQGYDGLTGLRTRQAFLSELTLLLERRESGDEVSVVLLDIDRFKAVNDQHGHARGDELLCELAERVTAAAPEGAVVARVGGELFGLALGCGREPALELAEVIRESVRERPMTEAQIPVTVTAGVSTGSKDLGAVALVREADSAVYSGKASGRDVAVHARDVKAEALGAAIDPAVKNFENMTRVVSERVAELLSRRGRALFDELQERADLDSLTGLYSRRYMDHRLQLEAESAQAISVALLDVDYFGAINKKFGWPTGDSVLSAVAERISSGVRSTDWVARYGGEEFLVVMPGAGLAQAHAAVERIRESIAADPFKAASGSSLGVTISAGVVEQETHESVEGLKERVSRLLLQAKAAGRNRVASASSEVQRGGRGTEGTGC